MNPGWPGPPRPCPSSSLYIHARHKIGARERSAAEEKQGNSRAGEATIPRASAREGGGPRSEQRAEGGGGGRPKSEGSDIRREQWGKLQLQLHAWSSSGRAAPPRTRSACPATAAGRCTWSVLEAALAGVGAAAGSGSGGGCGARCGASPSSAWRRCRVPRGARPARRRTRRGPAWSPTSPRPSSPSRG